MNIQLEFFINGLHIKQEDLFRNELYVKGITFQDRVTGEADQLDIEIIDPNGRWKAGLLPEKNDEFQVVIKGDGGQKFTSPSVWIDQVQWPDSATGISICRLSGLSLLYEKDSNIRKKRSEYYENTTLRTVVSGIAQRNGYTLTWLGTDIQLNPMDQTRESDYAFLQRLAKEQGAFIKFLKKGLIFATATDDLTFETNGNEVTATTGSGSRFVEIPLDQILDREFFLKANTKTKETYETLDVFNKKLNRTLGDFSNNLDLGSASGAALKTGREKGAQGVVTNAILGDTTCRFTYFVTPDGPRAGELLAGTVVYFTDAGKLVGTYRIKDAAQNLDPSNGWTVQGDLERITSKEISPPTSRQKYNKRKRQRQDKSLQGQDVTYYRSGAVEELERQRRNIGAVDGSARTNSLYRQAGASPTDI